MGKRITNIVCIIFIFFGFLALFSAQWCYETYGDIGFDAVLYTLLSELKGVSGTLILSYLKAVALPLILSVALVGFVVTFRSKGQIVFTLNKWKIALFPFNKIVSLLLSLALCLGLFYNAAKIVRADVWLRGNVSTTTLFDDAYVDPKNTAITFPEEKRNLIYIVMESMETTFFSTDQGGILAENAVPELYTLAADNINFSTHGSVGGIKEVPGATWTMGALVAQTAGVPLKSPFGANSMDRLDGFLPGCYTLTDILRENGYDQSFMCGSEATFGARKQYFEQHGVDRIYDYLTAQADGVIPEGYHDGWWGMEDYYLYNYAKQELAEISKQDQPFAFYMLTVDTHHVGGNLCPYCGDQFSEQYENVYACASKQLGEFINWVKEQDFYENTTVVVVGDHRSMDAAYMTRKEAYRDMRNIYNCILNAAVPAEATKCRTATQLDMFPTTLAALGCRIEGERLGLGTNLFSASATLAEEMGLGNMNAELEKQSDFYDRQLLEFKMWS